MDQRTPRAAAERWQRLGMTREEACNLTARQFGIRRVHRAAWTPEQIEALLFLRWLWRRKG